MMLVRLAQSIGNALRGFWFVIAHEQNFRLLSGMSVLLLAGGVLFRITARDFALLIVVIVLVLVLEMINSAFEYFLDLLKPRLMPHVGIVKDIIAGAVLLSVVGACLVGGIIFWPYIIGAL
ncbi:MAG: diacylglycerol kinase family protein [Patescibacteria group bacterium]